MSEFLYFAMIIGGIFIALVLFIGGLTTVGTRISKHYDEVNCHSFAKQANRETKFVTYSFWAWDCLTPTADGKWISTHNLREFGETP